MSSTDAPEENFRPLQSLKIAGWRQFDDLDIEFHDRLTVITGANGSGKTTILNVLSPHFGWAIPLVSSPPGIVGRVGEYLNGIWRAIVRATPGPSMSLRAVGTIEYGGIATPALIEIPAHPTGNTYQVSYQGNSSLAGIYVPAHRPLFYPGYAKPPSGTFNRTRAFTEYSTAVRAQWSERPSGRSPLGVLKEHLLLLASAPPSGDDDATLDAFSKTLAKVLPDYIGFGKLVVRGSDVVLETESGEFTLDAVSGGIAALFDLTWQIYCYSGKPGRFVVLIDEPENHLHPEIQRTILLRLVETFPSAQFVVTSHAPLVITSVMDANVYALRYVDASRAGEGDEADVDDEIAPSKSECGGTHAQVKPQRRVVCSERLLDFDKAGTANDILHEVLGLGSTLPVWAYRRLENAVGAIRTEDITNDQVEAVVAELEPIGLDRYLGTALWNAERGMPVRTAADDTTPREIGTL